ncbi:Lysozyme [Chionoecetes opilio]|uniref:lysozyme n=1 Tax=Chionoecetes opilio TaxID=41210 RepID=A0A8J4YP41_CHIOP|nr:Lysozyme [Chionoecetes opilio]
MSPLQRILVSVTVALVLAMLYGKAQGAEMDPNCLGCMCEASSNCNASTLCHTSSTYFCGPFHLTWAYWADAGKPVLQHDNPDRKGAFENCANDLYCAAETVKQYMRLFATDCDGDGVHSCKDYVRIHKLGKSACTVPIPRGDFLTKFETCAHRLNVF